MPAQRLTKKIKAGRDRDDEIDEVAAFLIEELDCLFERDASSVAFSLYPSGKGFRINAQPTFEGRR